MKNFIILLLGLFSIAYSQPSVIHTAEYYLDNLDPGYGNGIPIPVSNPNTTLLVDFSIPTATLSPGFHYANVRVKTDSAWSTVERHLFFVQELPKIAKDTAQIIQAEYYWGTNDPGMGLGQALQVPTASQFVELSELIPPSGLAPGFQTISVRVKQENGGWSTTRTHFFYLIDSLTTYKLTQFTYEIRQAGSVVGTGSVPISPSQYTVELNFDANTAALTPGFYDLCVTAVDEANRESTQACRVFQVMSGPMANEAEIDPSLSVFPNPTDGPMTITSETAPLLSYQLSDASGRVVAGKALPAGTRQVQLDLSQQAKGVYFLALEQTGRLTVKAVVKR